MVFFAIISLTASLISFFIGSFILAKNPGDIKNKSYFFLTFVTGLLALFEFEFRTSESLETAYFWAKAMGIWPISISLTYFFIKQFIDFKSSVKSKIQCALAHASALAICIVYIFTDLIISEPSETYWGWKINNNTNVATILAASWSLVISLSVLYLAYKYYKRSNDKVLKMQAMYISIGFLFIVAVSTITYAVLVPLKIEFPELTNTATIIGYLLVAYAMYKYKLFILSPASATDQIVETIAGSLILTDSQGKIIFLNTSSEELFGISRSKLIGKPISKLYKSESLNSESDKLITNIKFNESFVRNDQELLLLNVSRMCIRDQVKQVQGFVYLANDMSEMKELSDAREKAELTDTLKSAFILSIYEEIRGPLNNILNSSELLITSKVPDFEKKNYINSIGNKGKNLNKLFDKILEIVKIENQQIKLKEEACSINEIVNGVLNDISNNIDKRKLKIQRAKAIGSENEIVVMDKDKLGKIIELILETEISCTRKGVLEIENDITKDNHIQFSITSSNFDGSHKNIKRALRVLNKEDYLHIMVHGLPGINLAIAKTYTDLMNGEIWVENEKEETSISFKIPYKSST